MSTSHSNNPVDPIASLDIDRLQREYRLAEPFPWVCIDNFLDEGFAKDVANSYPSFDEACSSGRSFKAVNERRKVQLTDYDKFPQSLQRLADALASSHFLDTLTKITGIEDLVWDSSLTGGGLHQTAASGHLDVHVDFNMLRKAQLYRRLNLLLYLNPDWDDAWGGILELWDRDVKYRCQAFAPLFNRCVLFETSEISFHGVTAVTCPPSVVRKSFAAYYYTHEAPPFGVDQTHSTIFRARPEEISKRYLLMPAEKIRRQLRSVRASARRTLRSFLR